MIAVARGRDIVAEAAEAGPGIAGSTSALSAPRAWPRAPALMLIAGLAYTAVDTYLAVRWSTRGHWYRTNEIIQMLAWLCVGYLATRIRHRLRTGLLMLGLGLVLAGNSPAGLGLPAGGVLDVLVFAGELLFGLQLPLGVYICLTYPSGRTRDGAERGYLGAVAVFSCAVAVAVAVADSAGRQTVFQVNVVGSLVAVAVGVVLFFRRLRRLSRRERRVLRPPMIGITVAALSFTVWQSSYGLSVTGHLSWSFPTTEIVQASTVVAVPATFLLGLLRQRWDEAAVARLLRELRRIPAEQLQPALRRALGDPDLRLLLPGDLGFDVAAAPPVNRDDQAGPATSPIGDAGAPLAVLLHDRSLLDEPELIEAAREAIHFSLDITRLQTALHHQQAEVAATSRRLVQAGDTARRRIEQDLHDGAQQRLLTAGLALQLLRRSLADADERTIGLLAETEAQIRTAIAELRELAHGIHPAVLTSHGLSAALADLATRAPMPVRLDLTDPLPRLTAEVEATAYFVSCEALANVIKHANAANVRITVRHRPEALDLAVTDDGCGGAVLGRGLAGLRDRILAVGGTITLTSPPGDGTSLEAHLPCN